MDTREDEFINLPEIRFADDANIPRTSSADESYEEGRNDNLDMTSSIGEEQHLLAKLEQDEFMGFMGKKEEPKQSLISLEELQLVASQEVLQLNSSSSLDTFVNETMAMYAHNKTTPPDTSVNVSQHTQGVTDNGGLLYKNNTLWLSANEESHSDNSFPLTQAIELEEKVTEETKLDKMIDEYFIYDFPQPTESQENYSYGQTGKITNLEEPLEQETRVQSNKQRCEIIESENIFFEILQELEEHGFDSSKGTVNQELQEDPHSIDTKAESPVISQEVHPTPEVLSTEQTAIEPTDLKKHQTTPDTETSESQSKSANEVRGTTSGHEDMHSYDKIPQVDKSTQISDEKSKCKNNSDLSGKESNPIILSLVSEYDKESKIENQENTERNSPVSTDEHSLGSNTPSLEEHCTGILSEVKHSSSQEEETELPEEDDEVEMDDIDYDSDDGFHFSPKKSTGMETQHTSQTSSNNSQQYIKFSNSKKDIELKSIATLLIPKSNFGSNSNIPVSLEATTACANEASMPAATELPIITKNYCDFQGKTSASMLSESLIAHDTPTKLTNKKQKHITEYFNRAYTQLTSVFKQDKFAQTDISGVDGKILKRGNVSPETSPVKQTKYPEKLCEPKSESKINPPTRQSIRIGLSRNARLKPWPRR